MDVLQRTECYSVVLEVSADPFGEFQGNLNPLTGREKLGTLVMGVLGLLCPRPGCIGVSTLTFVSGALALLLSGDPQPNRPVDRSSIDILMPMPRKWVTANAPMHPQAGTAPPRPDPSRPT